jgi:hypothetical protein
MTNDERADRNPRSANQASPAPSDVPAAEGGDAKEVRAAEPERAAETRRIILSRKARFVGLALGGAGVAAGTYTCSPCLSAVPEQRTTEVTVPAVPGEQGTDGGRVATEGEPSDTGTVPADGGSPADTSRPVATDPRAELDAGPPRPCLSISLPHGPDGSTPGPRICLSFRPPTAPTAAPQICLSDETVDGKP